MLEIRPNCENCEKPLPNHSDEAMICTYECTFCKDCVVQVLKNVCPNCGGGFEERPTRPSGQLKKYPPRKERLLKSVLINNFLKKNIGIDPRKR